MEPSHLIPSKGLEDYFYHQVRLAFVHQDIKTTTHTEFYIVRLLSDFCHSDSLFPPEEDSETPLAIRYLKSLTVGEEERIFLLKQLGDFSLYISGFFQDSLHRKNVDLDYYMTMGGNAYEHLYSLGDQKKILVAFQETFYELALRFPQFVDVLSEISENTKILKNSDLLRLYEKWLATGSKRLLKKLNTFGIFPSAIPTQDAKH